MRTLVHHEYKPAILPCQHNIIQTPFCDGLGHMFWLQWIYCHQRIGVKNEVRF
jgi:hypothetical protein